jgi:hypothetical protein
MGRLIVNMPRYNVPEAGVTVALVNTRTAAVVARQNVHAGDTVVFEDIDRWMLTDEYRLRIRGVGILPFDTTAWRAGNDSSSEDVEHNPHFERDVVLPEIWPEEPPLRTTPQPSDRRPTIARLYERLRAENTVPGGDPAEQLNTYDEPVQALEPEKRQPPSTESFIENLEIVEDEPKKR